MSECMTPGRQDWPGPSTLDEARAFHNGFLAGLTAYAREAGHSTLKSENELLCRLADEQGWKTIETYERISQCDPPREAEAGAEDRGGKP